MHEILVNRLGGLSLPRKSVVRLTDRPDMTLDVYRGRKTTKQQLSFLLKIKPGHQKRCNREWQDLNLFVFAYACSVARLRLAPVSYIAA